MKLRVKIRAIAITLALCATAVFAQDQRQDTPPVDANAPLQPLNPAPNGGYSNPPVGVARGVSGPDNSQPYDPSQVTPDTNTLAGAQLFTLGSLGQNRNIFDPFLSFSAIGVDFPSNPGQSNLGATALLGGGLNLIRNWRHYRFTVSYKGGEAINTGSASLVAGQNTSYFQFQDLSVIQEANWARWHLLIRDDFIASPGAAFTGSGMGGPGLIGQSSLPLGTSIASVGQAFAPIQAIDTGNTMSYMNSLLGQAEYSINRSSTLTLSGSYGLLQFTNAGFVSSNMLNAQAGYDYKFDPINSIGVLASYGKIDYTGVVDTTTDYNVAFAYGRKITGRVAFKIDAGPEEIRSASASSAGNFQIWMVSINTALTYERPRSGYSFSYMRGLTAGSGVFLGAMSDTFSASGHYQFTRFWTGSINTGYAFNKSLAPAGSPTVSFDDWFLGANVGRIVGRHMQINFNYGLIDQINPSVCPVSSCGIPGIQQTFGMTVNWHLRSSGLNAR